MPESFYDRTRDDYLLTADESLISIATIHQWLSTEAYWALGRSREAVDTSIDNSYLYAIVTSNSETIACARMITDQVTF